MPCQALLGLSAADLAKWRFMVVGHQRPHAVLADGDVVAACVPVARTNYLGDAGGSAGGPMDSTTYVAMVHEDKGGPPKRSTGTNHRFEKPVKIYG